jgi:hypothetical protein
MSSDFEAQQAVEVKIDIDEVTRGLLSQLVEIHTQQESVIRKCLNVFYPRRNSRQATIDLAERIVPVIEKLPGDIYMALDVADASGSFEGVLKDPMNTVASAISSIHDGVRKLSALREARNLTIDARSIADKQAVDEASLAFAQLSCEDQIECLLDLKSLRSAIVPGMEARFDALAFVKSWKSERNTDTSAE